MFDKLPVDIIGIDKIRELREAGFAIVHRDYDEVPRANRGCKGYPDMWSVREIANGYIAASIERQNYLAENRDVETQRLMTSQEWCRQLGISVTDPDGWDRRNFEFSFREELITKVTFLNRVEKSTTFKF